MGALAKKFESTPSIKTPQELVHIKHKITLRQYKFWILMLRRYREAYENGEAADESGFYRISIKELQEWIGYEPVRAELRTDFEAIRKEPVIYNILGKDGKPAQRGAGFISEWEVSANWVGFKLPSFLAESVEQLDLKGSIFHQLNWSIFNSFAGKYEAILYKLCKDYIGVGRTPYMTIQTFREYMGLNEKEYSEFKDLNKFVITGPLKKINESEISDITITVEFTKESRKVSGLQFMVTSKHQTSLPFGDDPAFAHARIHIPISQQKKYLEKRSAEEIAMSIQRANEYAQEKSKKGEHVNLGAIYHTSITNGWGAEYRSRLAAEEEAKQKKTKQQIEARQKRESPSPARKAARETAIAEFNALPDEKKQELLEAFAATLKGPPLKAFQKSGLDHPLTGNAFVGWMLSNRR